MNPRKAIAVLISLLLLLTTIPPVGAQAPLKSHDLDGQWMGISCLSNNTPSAFAIGIVGNSGVLKAAGRPGNTVSDIMIFDFITYTVEDGVTYGNVDFTNPAGSVVTFKLWLNDAGDGLGGTYYLTMKDGTVSKMSAIVFQPDVWHGDINAFLADYKDVCKG